MIGDVENAEIFFKDAAKSGFRPALYQLAGLYNKNQLEFLKGKEICERIRRLEELNSERYNFINGLVPFILSDTADLFINLFNYCKYYSYYIENIEEIQIVRDFLKSHGSYNRTEFWDIVELNEKDKQFLKNKVAYYELLEFEQALFKAFDDFCKAEKEEGFLQKISNNNNALRAYSELKSAIDDEDFKKTNLTYEKALAIKIKDIKREQLPPKWFLVFTKLLYLKGYLTNREALCLHLYAHKLAIRTKDQAIVDGINLEIEEWFKALTGIPSPFIIRLAFKTFKFIQDGVAVADAADNDYNDYLDFKENYYAHLDFWKSRLIKEFS